MTDTAPAPIMPQRVSDAELVFPASAMKLMPAWDEIPAEFKISSNEWAQIASALIFGKLSEQAEFDVIDGIEPQMMGRHLQVIMGSYAPKHEHKEAAVAYLLSLWNHSITNWRIDAK